MQSQTRISRRNVLKAAGLPAALSLIGQAGWAQGRFPNRPVTLVCPFGAGGSVDQYMRTFGQALAKHLNTSVVIENKAGAGGTLAASTLSAAPPDGYRMLMLTTSVFRAPWLEPAIKYNPTTDFSYVIGLTSLEFAIAVPADSPIKTFKEFMEIGKSKPDSLTFAAGDPTTTIPLAMGAVERKYGVRVRHIPYKSGAEMITAMLGKQVDSIMDSVGALVPHVNAGKFRLLASLGSQRFKAFPDVPTARESGYELEVNAPLGLAGPKGVPAEIVAVWQDAARKAMQDPEVVKVLDLLNQPEWYRNSADYKAWAKTFYEQTGKDLRAAGLIKAMNP